MDSLTLLTIAAAAGAVFMGALALQTSLGSTRRAVRARTLGADSFESENGDELVVQRLSNRSRRGQLIAADLERAGLAFTVSEYVLLRLFVGVLTPAVFLLVALQTGVAPLITVLFTVLALAAGYLLPNFYVDGRKSRRLLKIEEQLLLGLTSMAKSLKAGIGLTQAMEYAGREMDEPLGSEFLRAVRELQLGADVEMVLEGMNGRLGSPDLDIVSTAITIQRRVGGNLSEILGNVGNTMRERRSIKSELRALTAKGRLQANLSALVPVLVGAVFLGSNWDTGRLMFETTLGNIALAGGIFFEVLGLWMTRRFSEIEV